jgi:hypothetical protein
MALDLDIATGGDGANGAARNGTGPYTPARRVPKVSEVTAGGAGGLASLADTLQVLGSSTTETRKYGDDLWEWMDRDAVAGSCVELLENSALSGDLRLVPSVTPRPGRPPEDPAAAELSARCHDLCAWAIDRLEDPILPTLKQSFDALRKGASLGEIVWDVRDYQGRPALVPRRIAVRPRRSWDFIVDMTGRPVGFYADSVGGLGRRAFPAEKFLYAAWDVRGGDPRGTPIYTRAVEAWNFRTQLPTEHFKFCQRFGSPVPVVTMPENPASGPVYDDGSLVPNSADPDETPFARYKAIATGLRSNRGVVLENGATAALLEPRTAGQVFTEALDYYAREMTRAILISARATMEAEHGSKADSGSANDNLANLVLYLRRWVARIYEWQLLYRVVLYNFGPEAADLHTPKIDLGGTSQANIIALMAALKGLGYTLTPEQFPDIDAALGGIVPVRELGDAAEPEPKPDGQGQPEADPQGDGAGDDGADGSDSSDAADAEGSTP